MILVIGWLPGWPDLVYNLKLQCFVGWLVGFDWAGLVLGGWN